MGRALLIATVGLSLMLNGCAGVADYGMSGASGALIVTNVTHPGGMDTGSTEYTFSPKEYRILGEVSGSGKSVNVLGIVASGNSGIEAALEDAKRKGADDIINLKVDTNVFGILGLFTQVTTKVSGLAVKWKTVGRDDE